MTNEDLVQKLYNNWRKILFIGLSVLLLIVCSQYGLVNVSVSETNNDTGVYRETGNGFTQPMRAGLNLLPRGRQTVIAYDKDRQTIKTVDVRPFWYSNQELVLDNQKAAKKIASKSQGCVFGSNNLAESPVAYSYACNRAAFVQRYSFGAKPLSEQFLRGSLFSVRAYGEGVLAFTLESESDTDMRLKYITPSATKTLNYSVDASLDTTKQGVYLLNDGSSSKLPGFIISNPLARQLVFFKGLDDNQPQIITMEGANDIEITAAGNRVYVLQMNEVDTEDSDIHEFAGGTLDIYEVANGKINKLSSQKVKSEQDIFGMKALSGGFIAVQKLNNIVDIYDARSGSIRLYDQINNASQIESLTSSAVILKRGAIFRYDPLSRTSIMLHRIEVLQPTTIQAVNDQVVFSASQTTTSIQYSFVITDEPRKSGLEKILSYPPSGSLRYIDYSGNKVYSEFDLGSYFTDRSTGTFGYDPQELTTKQQALIRRMEADGLETDSIQFINQ